MDAKGIDVLGINPAIVNQTVRADRRLPEVIKPVEHGEKTELNTTSDKSSNLLRLLESMPRYDEIEKRLRLLADSLAGELGVEQKKVKIRWRLDKKSRRVFFELVNEEDTLIRELSPDEIMEHLQGVEQEAKGVILDKMA